MATVTARDVDALRLTHRFLYVTIGQAEMCVYGNRNVAQRRLAVLASEGLLLSFPASNGGRGHPTRIYYLDARRRRRIEELFQETIDPANLVRTPPLNALVPLHAVELNYLLAVLMVACRDCGYAFEFIPEYWRASKHGGRSNVLSDRVQDPMNPKRIVRYRRDAVFCIGSQRGKALFELEYDRGRESAIGSGRRRVTVARKILIFLRSVRERRFERYSGPLVFGYPFQVSRLAVVTTSPQRLQTIASFCKQINTHGLVYLAALPDVGPESVFGAIWTVPDGDQLSVRRLGH